jgi:hypothetical protein
MYKHNNASLFYYLSVKYTIPSQGGNLALTQVIFTDEQEATSQFTAPILVLHEIHLPVEATIPLRDLGLRGHELMIWVASCTVKHSQ